MVKFNIVLLLIKSGGGNRPYEARQPAFCGKVLNSAVKAER